jgi:hypothetical protein
MTQSLFPLLNAALVLHLHLFFCVFLPGWAIRRLCLDRAKIGEGIDGVGTQAVEALAIGTLWSMIQFGVLYLITPAVGSFPVSLIKYGTDAATVVGCGWLARGLVGSLLTLLRRLCRPVNLVGTLVASMYGAFALLQFPAGTDNAALSWIAVAAVDAQHLFEETQGSPAYLSWLYWPAQLTWPHPGPATIGASAKIVLNVLAFFVAKRLCYLWPATSKGWMAILLYVLILFTFAGDYGLTVSGKETPFGVLFLFAAMACMGRARPMEEDEFRRHARESAAWLTLAFGFGAITIPYAAAYLSLALMLLPPMRDYARFLLYLAGGTALPLIFSVTSMVHKPLWQVSLAWAVGVIALHASRSWVNQIISWGSSLARNHRRIFETGVVLGLIFAVYLALPVTYEPCLRAPLDGLVDFKKLFITDDNSMMPWFINVLAFFGFLIVLCRSNPGRAGAGLVVLMAFPFACLLPTLLVAHAAEFPIPFHPQHLWDLAKDVPHWCWGIISQFFALVAVATTAEGLGSLVARRWSRQTWIRDLTMATTVLILSGLYLGHQYITGRVGHLTRWHTSSFLTTVGGHHNHSLAAFIHAFLSHQSTVDACTRFKFRRFYVDPSAGGPGIYYTELATSGADVIMDEGLDLHFGDTRSETLHASGYLIAPRHRLISHFAERELDFVFEELTSIKGGDSLFLFHRVQKPQGTLKLNEPAPFSLGSPTVAGNLGLAAPGTDVQWDNLASTKLRIREGTDTYLWCNQSGTIWVALPPHPTTSSELRLHLRFSKGIKGTVRVTSPLWEQPLILNPESRAIQITLPSDRLTQCAWHYDRQWMPLEFTYEGDLKHHERLGYLQSYCLEKLEVFGRKFIQ